MTQNTDGSAPVARPTDALVKKLAAGGRGTGAQRPTATPPVGGPCSTPPYEYNSICDRPSMLLLHKGFDNLDLSFQLTISDDLAAELEDAKNSANESSIERGCIDRDGRWFYVYAKGMKGGYTYAGHFSNTKNMWSLKKPGKSGDKWGLRVSCSARNLAIDGIMGVRGQLDEELAWFGLHQTPGIESIGRIDFAMDFLMPEFVIDADNFVMHPRNSRKRYALPEDGDITEHGRSSRSTSVTIGKNPNREVILYDKREEVMKKNSYWPIVWDANLARMGLPDLDLSDPKLSRVWRVEIRFFKRYLKDKNRVTSFGDLATAMLPMLRKTLNDIRYTQPNGDSNRSRWPDHPLWQRVKEEIDCDFEAIRSDADKETIEAADLAAKDGYLARQIAGCMLNRAALRGVRMEELADYISSQARQIAENYAAKPERTKDKLAKAKMKYGKM